MTCRECELLLADEEQSELIDEHVSMCPACREFELDLRGNAGAFAAMAAEPMTVVRRPRPARWPYLAAAAIAIAAALILMIAMPKTPQALPAPIARVAPPAPAPIQTVVHHARQRRVRHEEPQILQVKMLTDDPNVVIYWQVEKLREEQNK